MVTYDHSPFINKGEVIDMWSVGMINGHKIVEDALDQGRTDNCGNFTASRSSWYRYKMGLLRAGVVPDFTHQVLPIVDEYHSTIFELPYLQAMEKGIPLTNGESFFVAQCEKGHKEDTDLMIYELEQNGPFVAIKPIYESSSIFVRDNPGAVYYLPDEPEQLVSYHAVNIIGHGYHHPKDQQILVYEDTKGVRGRARGLGFMGINVPVQVIYAYPCLSNIN